MEEKIKKIIDYCSVEIKGISSIKELEDLRVKYAGKKGILTICLRSLGSLPQEERPRMGQQINTAKEKITQLLLEKKVSLKDSLTEDEFKTDVSLPGQPFLSGRTHPIRQIMREVEQIFVSMGFQIQEGPDVETDYYNFEALNIPPEPPARDMPPIALATTDGNMYWFPTSRNTVCTYPSRTTPKPEESIPEIAYIQNLKIGTLTPASVAVMLSSFCPVRVLLSITSAAAVNPIHISTIM